MKQLSADQFADDPRNQSAFKIGHLDDDVHRLTGLRVDNSQDPDLENIQTKFLSVDRVSRFASGTGDPLELDIEIAPRGVRRG